MIRAIVIDDEKDAREVLISLLTGFVENIEVIGEADSAISGKKEIETKRPDIVFLDINMINGTGFTLLSSFDEIDFEVIFTTAYSEHALKAIKFSALDYLLKPIELDELKVAVNKYVQKTQIAEDRIGQLYFLPQNVNDMAYQTCKVVLPKAKGFSVVPVADIIYCEASGSYAIFHLDNGTELLSSNNLKYFEEQLGKMNFLRVHDAFLINLNRVKDYSKGLQKKVTMSDGTELDISRSKKNQFLEKFMRK